MRKTNSLITLSAAIGALLIGSMTCATTNAGETEYAVGVAAVDVTPDYPVRLNGYGFRREESEGVTHRIWAKAMAISSGEGSPHVIVTLDNLGVRESMADEVAMRLKEKVGLEREQLAVTFTHTHTAPKVNGACDTIFSTPIPPEHQAHIDQYTRELTEAIEQVVLEAIADRQPSRLEWGVGNVGFAMNRRTPGGPVDHRLPVMVVRSAKGGEIRAIYVTYACHCTSMRHNKISGDWAGFAQSAIERNHPGAIAMVSIGCGSDSNPDRADGEDPEVPMIHGDELAAEVERLLATPLKPVTGEITATLGHIDLPLNPVPTREELEKLVAAGGSAGYNATYQLSKLDRGEELLSAIHYPIQTFRFGDSLTMVFLGGEICVDYSLRLQKELAAERVWLHGYSNDFGCYIPSERLEREGGYGGGAEIVYFALPSTLKPGLEDKIIGEVKRQVVEEFHAAR